MINWKIELPNFTPGEFSVDPDKYADPKLLRCIQALRSRTRSKIIPSPHVESLARFSGSKKSQHYVGNKNKPERLSTALDVFIEGIPIINYHHIIASGLFNGVGVYLDTYNGIPWVMFHLDIRKQKLSTGLPIIWFGVKELDKDTGKKITKFEYPNYNVQNWQYLKRSNLYHSQGTGV